MVVVGEALGRVHRDSWPAVVGATARLTRDLDLAEDCAQEAVERALSAWRTGVPDNPAAWLTTTARRIALDRLRRDETLRRKLPLLVDRPDSGHDTGDEPEPADPLRLVFTCCHPALAPESQVALTLRLVCGVPVPAIASVLLAGEAGVAARITRAKRKIAAARIPFRVPSDDELPARLDVVLTVVHLVYTAGHADPGAGRADPGPALDAVPDRSAPGNPRLTERAIELARMLVRLLPGEPEARGLLGLLLLTEARGGARTDPDGELVLLTDQDRSAWDDRLTREGLVHATAALDSAASPGRFALQSAVAGLHGVAPSWERTDWPRVVTVYDALMRTWPSPVVALNRAVARSRVPGTDPAGPLREIDSLVADPGLARYPYLPAARAELLARLGRTADAAAAYADALALSSNPVERRFLTRRVSACAPPPRSPRPATR
ncbi:DUF6596 domain-containing protein [Pseudonocardia nematodicida]|uniref:DUF6596 domain-containing protein n=1 Tax=Pseudonocardia nematodicida TaxID=1206997 RepID=A0ABV1K7S9_9PSEU